MDPERAQLTNESLSPGFYTAYTKIRLRTAPDINSEPTGDVVKAGEVFEVTDVVFPIDSGSQGYVLLGDRGWVFDRGVAGTWVGKKIIMRIPEVEQDLFKRIFANPETMAKYREAMASPDYVAKMRALLEDSATELRFSSNQTVPDSPEEAERVVRDFESSPETQQRIDKAVAEMNAELAGCADNEEEERKVMEAIKKLQEQGQKKSSVAPKWAKMTGNDIVTETPAEREERMNQRIKIGSFPGSAERLRLKPSCTGWRVGIRIPSVCSPL